MENQQDKKTEPLLPFDVTYGEQMNMYDNMPYIRNLAICGNDAVKMESGNVVKFFRCNAKKPLLIGGDKTDDDI